MKDGKAVHEAYLFAHMMHGDYGRLYYSVSLDGLHWRPLNQGRRVFEEYRGHADICLGHDGRYYLVGNRNDAAPDINFWVSDDLVTWSRYGDVTPNLKETPGYENALQRIGAPKLFYDQAGAQYILTWHTPHKEGSREDPERYWASQRTLYLTSKDLKTFSDPPRRLFPWDMATIDVVIRRQGDRYFALIKDERYPTLDWVTGKTIRISSRPEPLRAVDGAVAAGQSQLPRGADADPLARRQGVVPLLRAVSRRFLRPVRIRGFAGSLVPDLRLHVLRGLGQVQPAAQGASRLHDSHHASPVRPPGRRVRPGGSAELRPSEAAAPALAPDFREAQVGYPGRSMGQAPPYYCSHLHLVSRVARTNLFVRVLGMGQLSDRARINEFIRGTQD